MHEDAWLRSVAKALVDAGIGEPVVAIDLDRLDANAARLAGALPPGRTLRLVQKSLPSLPLLEHLSRQTGSRSLMVFHRPFLNHYAEQAPHFDLLLGKPLPVAAAHTFYDTHRPGAFDPGQRLRWLVDTPQRLQQYQALARTLGTRLLVSIEIDVGLRRGGLREPAQLAPLLELIAGDPAHLRWSGFMGYDSHASRVPPWSTPRREVDAANARYAAFVAWARARHPGLWHDALCFNGAGSGTFTLHGPGTPLNDLSVGSALLKPLDFELPTLSALQVAAVIATPVLKVTRSLDIPFVSPLSRLWGRVAPRRGQSVFVYGGKLMAVPVWPRGLRSNRLYGLSSNQQMLNLPSSVAVAPDEMVLWRPTQSEAVLLQHGALVGLRGGRVVERYAVDPER